jgi:acetylornithine deacetylase/succinyl-diaminopimelate desuccinylase-like protein
VTRRGERFAAAALLLALAAGVAALLVHNRREEADIARQLYVPKKEKITPEILRLQEYVRIDTSNPPGNEIEGARWLGRKLAEAGVVYEILEPEPRRASLYARIKGRRPGEGLLLLSHIDVVPANRRSWTRPPFSGSIAGNMLWGRGAIDVKGLALCQLEAFLAVARSGRLPERDIVFLAVADEESGSRLGAQWLLDHRPDIFTGVKYALAEGGITEVQKEELTYFGIETGSKMAVTADLTGPTRESIRRARIALEPYFQPRDPARLAPEVARYFRAVAPVRLEFRPLLADIDRTLAEGKFWVLPSTYRELTQNNVWAEEIDMKQAGSFRMRVHLINLPDEDPDERLRWLEGIVHPFGVSIQEVLVRQGPAPLSSELTPLFELLRREVRTAYGDVAVGPVILARSTSDARFLRPRGIVCYGFQPFRVDFFQSLSVHGVNERARLDWFVEGVELMKRVVSRFAETPEPM